jgi:hypothetical protein
MPNAVSTQAALQVLALTKGAGFGPSSKDVMGKLHLLDDKASMAVGITLSTEYVGFGYLPKGSKIIPHLSLLTTNHTATIAGKLSLVPLDGTTATDITGVVINLAATETTCIPDEVDSVTLTKDSWVRFFPTADTTIATTAKNVWARIAYTVIN